MKNIFLFMLLFAAFATNAQSLYFNNVETQIISPMGDTSLSTFNADLQLDINLDSMEIRLTEGILTQTRAIQDVLMLNTGETVLILKNRQINLGEFSTTIYFNVESPAGLIRVRNKYYLE